MSANPAQKMVNKSLNLWREDDTALLGGGESPESYVFSG